MAFKSSTNLTSMPSSMTIYQCTEFPPNVHSPGILKYKKADGLPYSLPNLEMQMVMIFAITHAIHLVLRNFGIPKFTSEILAGLILSPSLLGHYKVIKGFIFNIYSQEVLGLLAEFGYALFMFLIGVKMEMGLIKRSGQKALITGVACAVVPLVVSLLIQSKLSGSFFQLRKNDKLKFITEVHCWTPFPVVALLLEEMKILNSEIGRLSLTASLISDMFTLFLKIVGSLAKIGNDKKLQISLGSSLAYILVAVGILRPAMFWVIRQTPENRPVKRAYVNIIIVLVLASGVVSQIYGQAFHFGPFIFGLAVPAGLPLGSAIEDKLNMFVSDMILPIFVTTCSIRTNFWELGNFKTDSFSKISATLMVVAFVLKFLSSLVPPWACNMPLNDAMAIALILSCKGIVHLASYADLRDNQTINEAAFALSNIGVLLTATFVPIVVKLLYDPSRKYAGYQRRNVMHLKPNAELKILACIHRSSNMPAIINLIDAACPSKENPIAIYVLHLIELAGRAAPIFISHQMQRKSSSNTSYSDNVILFFNNFVRENLGAVSLSIFTAVSPPKCMHEDICTLALDKLVSLIVLPFHRKWSIDGSVVSDDNTIRSLNSSVLDIAPCSIGILVDRGHLGQSTTIVAPETSSFSVAVIFLGGKDDREALAFAKRMAHDSTISLTVIQLVAKDQEVGEDWDSILDTEEMKNFRLNRLGEGSVKYLEEAVKDGPQTASALRNMADEYDLIIVGRRHNIQSPQTAGLSEWSEFPELGLIGDLLASPDINLKASVLVVQQQIMAT